VLSLLVLLVLVVLWGHGGGDTVSGTRSDRKSSVEVGCMSTNKMLMVHEVGEVGVRVLGWGGDSTRIRGQSRSTLLGYGES
jgi:hypothetical protein